jgi:hypothetical protein
MHHRVHGAWCRYDVNARIHSNSWGSDDTYYEETAQEVDTFTWAHPEMLVLFAAGVAANKSVLSDGARICCITRIAIAIHFDLLQATTEMSRASSQYARRQLAKTPLL